MATYRGWKKLSVRMTRSCTTIHVTSSSPTAVVARGVRGDPRHASDRERSEGDRDADEQREAGQLDALPGEALHDRLAHVDGSAGEAYGSADGRHGDGCSCDRATLDAVGFGGASVGRCVDDQVGGGHRGDRLLDDDGGDHAEHAARRPRRGGGCGSATPRCRACRAGRAPSSARRGRRSRRRRRRAGRGGSRPWPARSGRTGAGASGGSGCPR